MNVSYGEGPGRRRPGDWDGHSYSDSKQSMASQFPGEYDVLVCPIDGVDMRNHSLFIEIRCVDVFDVKGQRDNARRWVGVDFRGKQRPLVFEEAQEGSRQPNEWLSESNDFGGDVVELG
jgi:hypothetical protein